MKPRGRLVEHVDLALAAHLGGQLQPLPFTAGKGGQRLADRQVAKADVPQAGQHLLGGRYVRAILAEEVERLVHRHLEDVGDAAAAEFVLEHRSLETASLAFLARGRDGRHDPEVGVDHAGAVAGRAGAIGVGAEEARLDLVLLGEGLADRVEQSTVGGRVAPPGTPDRRLVHGHHAFASRHRPVDERALAGTGHPGDHGEHTEGDVKVYVPQVVGVRAADLEFAFRLPHLVFEAGPVLEMTAGDGLASLESGKGAFEADLTAAGTGTRPEVDDVVGDPDHLGLVLDHQNRVALVPQSDQEVVHAFDVMRVHARGRLVEDVGDVGQR